MIDERWEMIDCESLRGSVNPVGPGLAAATAVAKAMAVKSSDPTQHSSFEILDVFGPLRAATLRRTTINNSDATVHYGQEQGRYAAFLFSVDLNSAPFRPAALLPLIPPSACRERIERSRADRRIVAHIGNPHGNPFASTLNNRPIMP